MTDVDGNNSDDGWSDEDFNEVSASPSEEFENEVDEAKENLIVEAEEEENGNDEDKQEKDDVVKEATNEVEEELVQQQQEEDTTSSEAALPPIPPPEVQTPGPPPGVQTPARLAGGGETSDTSFLSQDTINILNNMGIGGVGSPSNKNLFVSAGSGESVASGVSGGGDPDASNNNNTRELLLNLESLDHGPSFEQIMKERTKMRRKKEEYHIAELRVKVHRLEQALVAEAKRRVEAVKKLETHAKEEIQNMENKIINKMDTEHEWLEQRFDAIETRIEDLENRWTKDIAQQKNNIENKSQTIQQVLTELRSSVETERKSRLIREGRLLQQIDKHSSLLQNLLKVEANDRNASLDELQTQVSVRENDRNMQQQSFETKLQTELNKLQKELNMESYERQSQDQAIAAALNRYTQQFQASLSILTEH